MTDLPPGLMDGDWPDPPDDYMDGVDIQAAIKRDLGLDVSIDTVKTAIHRVSMRRSEAAEFINGRPEHDPIGDAWAYVYGWFYGVNAVLEDLK